LLILLLIVLLASTYTVFNSLSSQTLSTERQSRSASALTQAKDALLGFAVTYRDTHANQVFGFLPCPDADNDGLIDASCGLTDVSVAGHLPWQSLALPTLRDTDNECLWYAVSGSAKDTPKTAVFNWDTLGQFIVQDAAGTTTLAGANAHERPLAMVFAPRSPIAAQARTSAGTTVCGGNNTSSNYLDALAALGTGTTVVKLSTADSIRDATNNDQALWITSKDVFDRIKKRTDFKSDIDTLMDDLSNYLNSLATASLPAASASNKGIDTLITNYLAANPALSSQKTNVLNNWQDHLLYTKPASTSTVNSTTGCIAVLLFGGERTSTQSRASGAEKLVAANYLEATNATTFPSSGTYTGATSFDGTSSSTAAAADIVRCIKGAPTQVSFVTNFSTFVPAGAAVATDTSVPSVPTVTISDNTSGSTGGCFWQSTSIPLAGKTLRVYYEHQFTYADTYALNGLASDRGDGFTFQMVRGDIPDAFGAPSAPNTCGRESRMGSLSPTDTWGSISFIVETDIQRDTASATSTSSRSDPAENHTAIMTNGNLNHAASGTMSTACNGTASGCRHSPANLFEEATSPLVHKQRIEVHTGCNSTCSSCTPANHVTPNTYARITVWADCTDCSDVASDLNRTTKVPTVQRCNILNTEMNSIYFGLTAGFLSNSDTIQGVIFKNLVLRSD
jgi:hypothetical protein